ncbi:EexN family lipoprotein [Phenylobacterium sp. J367]|uniref:EexN family lipoprotein n=1 Tax=Phenylobacterium sp. J367 TaxID=2898435 RepID=UPI0021510904|nr:EexN family lipoprotein [Phenylobacterium sp. J367]MCR5879667.1 EexN family lipoprotein [Phenylobacterium sp. J367]
MRLWILISALAAAGCSPLPRDISWFAVHPEEAQRVVTACASGAQFTDCENARVGLGRAKSLSRETRYRSGAH